MLGVVDEQRLLVHREAQPIRQGEVLGDETQPRAVRWELVHATEVQLRSRGIPKN